MSAFSNYISVEDCKADCYADEHCQAFSLCHLTGWFACYLYDNATIEDQCDPSSHDTVFYKTCNPEGKCHFKLQENKFKISMKRLSLNTLKC